MKQRKKGVAYVFCLLFSWYGRYRLDNKSEVEIFHMIIVESDMKNDYIQPTKHEYDKISLDKNKSLCPDLQAGSQVKMDMK